MTLEDYLQDPRIPDDLRTAIQAEIAAREEAQHALRASETRLALAASAADLTAWQVSAATGDFWRGASLASGRPGPPRDRQPIALETAMGDIHPDDVAGVREALSDYLEGRVPCFEAEYRLRTESGAWAWHLSRGQLVPPADGQAEQDAVGVTIDITALREAQEEARESERRLALAMAGAKLTWWQVDLRTGEADWDRRWVHMSDPPSIPDTTESMFSLLHPDDAPVIRTAIREHAAGKRPDCRCEYRVRAASGGWHWHAMRGQVCAWDAQGDPTIVAGIAMDVSEQKAADEAVARSEERLALAMTAARVTWFEFDVATRHLEWDRQWLHMRDAPPAPQTPDELYALVHPEDLKRVWETVGAYVAGEIPRCEFEYRMRTASGGWRWHSLRGQACAWDEDGTPRTIAGVTMDITPRKEAEEALRESEERFRTLVGNLPGAIYRCRIGERWRMEHMSDGIEALTGYPAGDFVGDAPLRSWRAVVVPEDFPTAKRWVDQGVASRTPIRHEYRVVHADGSVRWVHERARALCSDDGEPLWLDGVVLDVTEHRQAEELLRESEERFRTLVGNLPGAVYRCWLGSRWRMEHMSDGIEVVTGYPADDFMRADEPREWATVVLTEDLAEAERVSGAGIRSGEPYALEYRIRHADGGPRWVHERARAILSHEGAPLWLDGVILDVTARKEAELALARANAELEEFASVVSHDLRAPLATTGFQLYRLAALLPQEGSEEARAIVDELERSADGMGAMITDLLACAQLGRGALSPVPIDLRDVLGQALANLDAAVREAGATVTCEELPSVLGDPTQLVQLFQNLIGNALKFRRDAAPHIRVVEEPSPRQGFHLLAVYDNGIGIDPWNLSRIFVMFRRAHHDGRYAGTGIGLAICKRIVERHGGRIWAESRPGEGSVLRFLLPARQQPRLR